MGKLEKKFQVFQVKSKTEDPDASRHVLMRSIHGLADPPKNDLENSGNPIELLVESDESGCTFSL
jgi:hypothetical protein